MSRQVIEGVHYRSGEIIEVTVQGATIENIQPIKKTNTPQNDLPIIGPGFVDLQINGYAQKDFNTLPIESNMVRVFSEELLQEGVTTYYPTIITNSGEAIETAVRTIAEVCQKDAFIRDTIGGIHVEGPFISAKDGPRGAHPLKYIQPPNWELFQRWQEAAGGMIKIITLSPEWKEAPAFIRKCVREGVRVSIGHTAANTEQIKAAVEAGASMSTHLGNGAHPQLPRHPNYIWDQLAEEQLWTCLIADGFHLPESVLKVAMRTKKGRAMIVSDAVFLSGMPPGDYETHIGGAVTLSAEGKLHMQDQPGLLAGSVQLLKHGVEHLVQQQLCDLDEAWEMASIRPSTYMDVSTKVGMQIGGPADLVLMKVVDGSLQVQHVYKSGKRVDGHINDSERK